MALKTFITQAVYPVSSSYFLSQLKDVEVLMDCAKPLLKYVSTDNEHPKELLEGHTYNFEAKFLSIFPIGRYSINFLKMEDKRVYSKSTFSVARQWTHYIDVEEVDENKTMCTHQVDMDAGWKTPIIYFITKLYYMNKQRKWMKRINKVNRA